MRHLISILAFLAITYLPCIAEDEYRWFHHIREIPDDIRIVCPDKDGRVWFGTSRGLFRYGDYPDGVRYDHLPELYRHGIENILPFVDDKFLIRSTDGRLSVYDPLANCSEDLQHYLNDWGMDIPEIWNLKFKKDPHGGLWCFTPNEVYHKSADTGEAELVFRSDDNIWTLDSHGNCLCVVTDSNIHLVSTDDPDHVRSFAHDIEFHGQYVWGVMDKDCNIWIGNDHLFRFENSSFNKECIRRNLSVMEIIRNRKGEILVATATSGILHFGKDGRLIRTIEHKPFVSGSLPSNNVLSIREGCNGELWVCYNKPAVSVCAPGSMASPLRHILPLIQQGHEENVISMAEAPDGSLWFGTDGKGIFVQDRISGEFRMAEIPLSHPSITALFFDSKGRTWIGTYRGGLYCLDGRKTVHLLPNASCCHIMEDSHGDIWVSTQGDCAYRISGDLKPGPERIDLSYNKWVFQITEGNGTMFAVTSSGLLTIDPDTLVAERMTGNRSGSQTFSNTQFYSAVIDSRGLLWICGKQSRCPLEIVDIMRDTIIHIPELEGQIVRSIIETDDRNIWLALEKDIAQVIVNFNPATGQYSFHPQIFKIRSEESAINYNNRCAIKLCDGSILFGGTAGFKQIYPSSFPPHMELPSPPAVEISSVRINNEYVRSLYSTTGITLKHHENNISLAVSACDYASPFETSLNYRIHGSESSWKPVRGNMIDLPRLNPGHYDLEITSSLPDTSISGPVCSFAIDIQAPWYATWWAIAFYLTVIISGISLCIYYYIDRQKHKMFLAQIRMEAERQHQLNEMKIRFFTNISHDLRTPLSLIITPLETYLENESHKEAEKVLRPVYKNAVRLLNLVNQILDFRKMEVAGMSLNLSYGNIIPFLNDICSSFLLFADETGKEFRFIPSQEDILTSFDKDKLTKIMMNLLSNAFKFTPKNGSVTVRVMTEGKDAVIMVEDTGRGIPDGQKESIFDRFYQQSDDAFTQTGSGIGLHIVKEFVKMHEGTVTVADNHPSGSVFIIRLPIKMQESLLGADEDQEMLHLEGTISADKTLLLVEDNSDFRYFMKEQLSEDYSVRVAENGKKALEILEDESIDVVISDIMMEEMDGLQLCKNIKTTLATSHIPVILLTAKTLAEDEIRGFELGADDYVTKPFHLQILKHRIRKLLEDRTLHQKQFQNYPDISPSEITITSLDEEFLSRAVHVTEENMSDPDFSVEKLSIRLGIHRTHLYKKILSLTGKTPMEFIRLIRMKRAAQYLEKSQRYVSEIAYMVGFNSPKIFARHFKEEFGMTPTEYQQMKQNNN